mmetsp:Transcript_44492/g.102693  ORF Transcript_44492/g.102693 Transcript_44492/m.102693 type:complete len:413 (+) Transcript_44492:83-1321(+)
MDATAYYGGDPSYYAQAPAAAPVMSKAEKEELVLKLLKRERRKDKVEAKVQEAGAVLYTVLFLAFINSVSWLCPLFLSGWHDKAFLATGVKQMRIRTSLTTFNISVLCGKNSIEDRVCHLLQKADGEYPLRELMDYACLTRSSAAGMFGFPFGQMLCEMMKKEFYVSVMPMIVFPLVSILYLLAMFFMYFYFESSHRQIHRTTGMTLLTIAPVIGLTGWLVFTFVAPDLSELPIALTGGPGSPLAMLAQAGGGDGSGLGAEVNQVDFGRAWFMTILCLVWSGLTVVFTYNFMEAREDELIGEEKEEEPSPPVQPEAAWQSDYYDQPPAAQFSTTVVGSADGGGWNQGGGDWVGGEGGWSAQATWGVPAGNTGWEASNIMGSAPVPTAPLAPGGQTTWGSGMPDAPWGAPNRP